MLKVLLIIILVVCTLSCDNSSDKVVSKSKMEQVLYDYHLAQALIATLPEEERYKAEMYIESVYEKNGITHEEFDSSMVYYNRHVDELKDIYNNLHDASVPQATCSTHLKYAGSVVYCKESSNSLTRTLSMFYYTKFPKYFAD